MVEKLYAIQFRLLESIDDQFTRFNFEDISWNHRFVGIKGLRGVGKTTLLLQHLKYHLPAQGESLYVSLDNPYFYNHSLVELIENFSINNGKTILLDEVHRYVNWSSEIKHIYDSFPDLQLIYTSSSALDLYRGEADLSRRVLITDLPGLSFREYLEMRHNIKIPRIEIQEIIADHMKISSEILKQIKPIPLFKDYLKCGYFPFFKTGEYENYLRLLYQIINATLLEDLTYIENYSIDNIESIKKLIGVIAEVAPFQPNISKIASKLTLGRNTVTEYLHSLKNAGILNFLQKDSYGISRLQKPDKIYMENPNFSYVFHSHPNIGTLRETFFINQVKNSNLTIFKAENGDFRIDDIVFEIGGKSKGKSQIKNVPNSFLIADDIEIGFGTKIPLYLFGFLY